MAATTVSKDSIVYREFMVKVKALGGWIENEEVLFPNTCARRQFDDWLADCNAD